VTVTIPESPVDLRERPRWKRAVIIAALFIVPPAVIEWPWSFLPLRWQYGLIRDADPTIDAIDRLSAWLHRPLTHKEFLKVAPDPLVAYRLNYEPTEDGYRLLIVCGFDCAATYDSRTRRWRK